MVRPRGRADNVERRLGEVAATPQGQRDLVARLRQEELERGEMCAALDALEAMEKKYGRAAMLEALDAIEREDGTD
jgi:hypothetical protein